MTVLSSLFEQVGEKLDAIIDVYERGGNKPYFPTGFPTGIRLSSSENNNYLLIKWNSSTSLTIIESNISTSGIQAQVISNKYYIRDYKYDRFNFSVNTDFSSPTLEYDLFNQYEWIDPATLPT